MSTVYSGLCHDGPLKGKTMAKVDQRKVVLPNDDSGFYVYAPAARGGAQPAGWRWVKQPVSVKPE